MTILLLNKGAEVLPIGTGDAIAAGKNRLNEEDVDNLERKDEQEQEKLKEQREPEPLSRIININLFIVVITLKIILYL
jgi:hypothetical protein